MKLLGTHELHPVIGVASQLPDRPPRSTEWAPDPLTGETVYRIETPRQEKNRILAEQLARSMWWNPEA